MSGFALFPTPRRGPSAGQVTFEQRPEGDEGAAVSEEEFLGRGRADANALR